MVKDLFFLLPEIREQIYNYCKVSDLKKLSRCSSCYHHELIYLLFNHLKIPWSELEDSSNVAEKLRYFKFTTSIVFQDLDLDLGNQYLLWNEQVIKNYMMILSHCHKLKSLHLFQYSDHGLKMTLQLNDNLQHLLMSYYCYMKGPCWKYITNKNSLRRLSLFACNISDYVISNISKHTKLEELEINDCVGITKHSLQYISDMRQLKKLTFSNNGNTFEFAYLAKLDKLTYINLSGNVIDKDCTACIFSSSVRITSLYMHTCFNLTDTHLSSISIQTSLEKLDLSSNDITDVSLHYISSLKALTELFLSSNRITDEGIYMLNSLTSLSILHVDHCFLLTDSCLPYLEHLSLTELCLDGCNFTNIGMSFLKPMPSLAVLEIMKCGNISDEGLNHISSLLRLKKLKITLTQFSSGAINRLCEVARLKRYKFCESYQHWIFINSF